MTADLFRVVTPTVEHCTSQTWDGLPALNVAAIVAPMSARRAALVYESASSGRAGHATARLTQAADGGQ